MFIHRIVVAALSLVFLALGGCGEGMSGSTELLPAISTTTVVTEDVVATAEGKPVLGSPLFAERNGLTVWWFASEKNRETFKANPANYRSMRSYPYTAFFGADIVARFPGGVFGSALGPVVPGNLEKHRFAHKGAVFAFASAENRAAFAKDPEHYIPPVGGYCLGAMSQNRITPGDPRNVHFVSGVIWGVYGSPDGPKGWAAKTSDQQVEMSKDAFGNYYRRIGRGG